jgi:hypothetical protein
MLRPHLPCFPLTDCIGEHVALLAVRTFVLIRKPVPVQTPVAHTEVGPEAVKG